MLRVLSAKFGTHKTQQFTVFLAKRGDNRHKHTSSGYHHLSFRARPINGDGEDRQTMGCVLSDLLHRTCSISEYAQRYIKQMQNDAYTATVCGVSVYAVLHKFHLRRFTMYENAFYTKYNPCFVVMGFISSAVYSQCSLSIFQKFVFHISTTDESMRSIRIFTLSLSAFLIFAIHCVRQYRSS